MLTGALITRSKEASLNEIIATIADKGAEASIRMHQDSGFKEIGRMGKAGFKFGRWLDAVLMLK